LQKQKTAAASGGFLLSQRASRNKPEAFRTVFAFIVHEEAENKKGGPSPCSGMESFFVYPQRTNKMNVGTT
jgi:hypothetical protein